MAATEYFTSQEDDDFGESEENTAPDAYTGPRTLDGRPAPVSATPTASSRPPTTGFATLGSLNQASASSQGHQHGHDDVDLDDEEYQPRDLFAGGEKSGLVVQDPKRNDPKRLVNDIIQKAQMLVPLIA
jgi:UBX domain-containing protein 1